ncbi:transcriptional regulator [Komagataeibacter rhaeticus]|uniref:Rrf2 family transcriptional regulator n=1 Tax=Komagataeibacter rhaeticus TaxID=215221 RepID=A0A181CD14_9PROT|nr:Rrf2 family transcriptional regulator [Komagataeibacter rhaeticus]ATU72142.1 transcriptional regulator [Komagataeibacter xylinus]EGG75136.1 Putative HTH-type transcriptional regulator ORF2 [Gluconacetobacter sp. SXCC-1]KDU97113.1 Rrf2 family transcriptional regulator [Komagataeibacter rhaeticus AF1]MBL7240445.1 Rrf2 family transcriptional regulator [Komagataeibacter rhaeticus]PYD53747.1 transcriptional regulator [Komagataeibacter rhaeticus]
MLLRRDRTMIAILIMLDVAFHAGRNGTISAADIAERAGLARRGIEPLLQTLSRSGLLESVRGPRGGYRLGRPRRDILLADILSVITAEDNRDDGPVGDLFSKVVEPCWQQFDSMIDAECHKISLDDLVRRAEHAGMRRPLPEPITFSI